MSTVPIEAQQALDALCSAVAEALERKRRLGQYAAIWRDGKIVRIDPQDIALLYRPAPGAKTP